MSITIEKARPEDAEKLLAYLKQIGGETDNLSFGKEGLPFSVEAEAEYIAGMTDSHNDVMLLAKENGEIVGDASLHRLPRRMNHRGELGISVVKSHWNRGIGSRLLSEILAFARENRFEIIDLEVRSNNAAAIHLYEKHGFQRIFTYKGFMKINGESVDAEYMCLLLN